MTHLLAENYNRFFNNSLNESIYPIDKAKQIIKNTNIGDVMEVENFRGPRAPSVKVKILTKFKKLSSYDFYYAFCDYKGQLECVSVDFQDKEMIEQDGGVDFGIGGNWEENFNQQLPFKLAKKFNLKY